MGEPLLPPVKSILNKPIRYLQSALRRLQITWYKASSKPKEISAIIRARNEGEYLYVAVKSIIDYVEELVIIDNLSIDGTARIIESLRKEYPDKVICYEYRYEVRRVGRDNWELAAKQLLRFSPHLLANYYNWSLKKSTKPYVLKWDGDMIATDTFYHSLAEFRQSNKEIMWIKGANIHPDLKHLVAPNEPDLERLEASLIAPTRLCNWMTPYTDYEPRLFPRVFARYDTGFWWCERLQSPFLDGGYASRHAYKTEGISYLHMKYCKRDPYANFSDDFKTVISSNMGQGPSISAELAEALNRWGLDRALR